MIDFFMPRAIFERVMGNEKIKKKFWGFFWREMLVYMAIVFLIIAILILTVRDTFISNSCAARSKNNGINGYITNGSHKHTGQSDNR